MLSKAELEMRRRKAEVIAAQILQTSGAQAFEAAVEGQKEFLAEALAVLGAASGQSRSGSPAAPGIHQKAALDDYERNLRMEEVRESPKRSSGMVAILERAQERWRWSQAAIDLLNRCRAGQPK
jgi:hypothetical protein